jgi:BirA family biotin operon repressor/biotin-[acetyl-CoA-carboxylase] ligase
VTRSFPRPEALPPDLAEAWTLAAGDLGLFARAPLYFAEVSSTNDVAAALADQGATEGVIVVSNAQSAGRGRQGRSWVSPPGAGLYVSALLRPRLPAPLLTIAAGVAVAEGIQRATGLTTDLKWPNDVFVGGKKLAGLLAEASGTPAAVVLGFGINVMPAAYPPDVAARATSLEGELGRLVDRGRLLVACVGRLAARYADLAAGRGDVVVDAWRDRATATFGRRVRGEAGGMPIEGVVEAVDAQGALVVRTVGGPARVTSGEVTWL